MIMAGTFLFQAFCLASVIGAAVVTAQVIKLVARVVLR